MLLYGVNADVISYAVCDDEAYFNTKAQEDWSNLCVAQPELPLVPIKTLTNDKYIGPGYGKAGEEIFDTLAELARLEGITLDPVYTGKAFYGLITDLANAPLPPMHRISFLCTQVGFSVSSPMHRQLRRRWGAPELLNTRQ